MDNPVSTVSCFWIQHYAPRCCFLFQADTSDAFRRCANTTREFKDIKFRWLWAGAEAAIGDKSDGDKPRHGRRDDNPDQKYDHGAGVLSKAVGKQLGVARKANVAVVRLYDKRR